MKAWCVRVLSAAVFFLILITPKTPAEMPSLKDTLIEIPWSDFQRILEQLANKPTGQPETAVSQPEQEPPPPPPVDYTLHDASLKILIGAGFASIEADYKLDVLKEGDWVTIPIGRNDSGVHHVLLDGKPAIVREEGGSISILLKGAASHKLRVSYAVTAPQNPGPNSFDVFIASIAGGDISLTAPAELSEIAINGAVITNLAKRGKKQSIRAITGAIGSLHVTYTVPTPAALTAEEEKLPPKIYSNVELLLSISDENLSGTAIFHYDIKHSPLSKFSIAMPAGYDVLNVTGQGVAAWKEENDTLIVNVNYEVQGPYQLVVDFESKRDSASGAITIPEPKTLDVERESGYIGVHTPSSLEINMDQKIEGMTAIDPSELPASVRQRTRYPIIHAFRFGGHPYLASLSVIRHEEIPLQTAAIDTVNLVTFYTEDGKSVTRIIYEIRNNKKQYLKIDLPKEADVWSAYLDDEPVKPAKNDKGQTLVPLKKSGADGGKISFTVELIYYVPTPKFSKKGNMKLSFPKADIPASEMIVSLYLPPKFRYKNFEGDMEQLSSTPVVFKKEGADYKRMEAGESGLKTTGYVGNEGNVYSKRAISRQNALEQEVADEITQNQRGPRDSAAEADQSISSLKPTAGTQGMFPIKFSVPLRGTLMRFSKLMVLDEEPKITFNYKKMRKPLPWNHIFFAGKAFTLGLAAAIIVIFTRRFINRRRGKKSAAPIDVIIPPLPKTPDS